MQITTALRRCACAVAFIAAFSIQTGTQAAVASEEDSFAKTVLRVYERYAWVVVLSISSPSGVVPLAQASHHELQEVFTPDLAQAIWNDAQCAEERQEICILDFDILFDSQDPSATELTVQGGARKGEVLACFKEVAGTRKCLTFWGTRVGDAVRVADIVYPGQRSLRRLFGLPGMH